jgi:hypothetical protein
MRSLEITPPDTKKNRDGKKYQAQAVELLQAVSCRDAMRRLVISPES